MSSNLFSNLEISLHFFQLAQVLIKENNFSKALAILKISLRHNPDYPIIYFSISKTLHSLNNDIEALEWNNKILETIEKLNNNDMNESIKFNTWSLRFEIIEKIPGTTEKLIQNLNEFEFNLNKDEFIKPKTKQNLIEKTKTKREKLFSICKILKNVKKKMN